MKASFDNIVKLEYNRTKEDHNKIYLKQSGILESI